MEWQITKDAENEKEKEPNEEEKYVYNNYKRGGKQWDDKYKTKSRNTFDNRQKFKKNKQRDRSKDSSRGERSRGRSRSFSKDRSDYDKNQN